MNRAGFDKYITVFSPEGSLYQVEYAFKAVTYPGVLSVAIRFKDGVLVVTQCQIPDRLMRADSVTALYEITAGIGCCMTGRAPDGRALVQRAREEASDYYYRFGVPIPIALLAKRIGDKAQVRTQQAGLRPMGVVSIFIGMDRNDEDGSLKPQIFSVDPAGWTGGHIAYAAGKKQVEAMAFLEKRQKSGDFDALSEKEAAMILLAALQSAIGTAVRASEVEMGRCTVVRPEFQRVPSNEVEEWLTAVAEAD